MNTLPHTRNMFTTEYILIIATATIGTLAAFLSSIYPYPSVAMMDYSTAALQSVGNTVVIFDDSKLRGWCIAGSCGGAILSIFLFPLPNPKELAFKLLASGISGMMFSPMFLRWIGWQVDVDTVLFTSGGVALFSWGVLQILVPLVTKFVPPIFAWFAKKFFGIEPDRTYKGVNGEDIQPKP